MDQPRLPVDWMWDAVAEEVWSIQFSLHWGVVIFWLKCCMLKIIETMAHDVGAEIQGYQVTKVGAKLKWIKANLDAWPEAHVCSMRSWHICPEWNIISYHLFQTFLVLTPFKAAQTGTSATAVELSLVCVLLLFVSPLGFFTFLLSLLLTPASTCANAYRDGDIAVHVCVPFNINKHAFTYHLLCNWRRHKQFHFLES